MELQTLTRLPKTRAIIFPFKTYLYPLEDIKDEGLGPQLIEAIEGLQKGNAPGMFKYKGAVRWVRTNHAGRSAPIANNWAGEERVRVLAVIEIVLEPV